MKAIILAGGRGTRLKPYTTYFPKPLMPIGEKPILEIVIRQLKEFGINKIIIATGYLEELIRAYFQNGEKFNLNISYSKEDSPLGTAGPLNLVKGQLNETFLVMNGDVLSDIDFSEFYSYHRENKNIATIALTNRSVKIDFGVVEVDKNNLFLKWNEKPVYNYLVSMGIYLFEPEALKSLPESGFINLPDFIKKMHDEEKKLSSYLHNGYWLDIGRPEDYEKACKDFEVNF
jgi:NDP-sugar pyrophosphorylase family protein